MKRFATFAVLFTIGCSGGKSDATGPKPVATVSVATPSTTIAVGQQVALSFTAFDAGGSALAGRTVAWSSSSVNVASVTATGVATGVAAGTATITATVEGKSGTTNITVTGAAAGCTGVAPVSLLLGETRILSSAERANLCFTAGAAANEYLLLALNNSLDTTGQTLAVRINATGTTTALGDPVAAASARAVRATPTPFFALSHRLPRDESLDARLRQMERTELRSRFHGGVRGTAYTRSGSPSAPARTGRAAINGLNGVPTVGTLVTLNTSLTSCSNDTLNTGRVVAVGTTAIIIADTLAPAGGFTATDYQSFATTFDTLVYAMDVNAFGAPSDMDNNGGRVVIFFTPAVNQLTAPGATSIIGGFFHARDLFPVVGNASLAACPTSNQGEMFYVPVVDPKTGSPAHGKYNDFYASKDAMVTQLIGTLAHEFQHLINAGRRMYVNNADDFEEVWLNEGLSHMAEELLYYRVSGLSPQSDLTLAAVTANQKVVDAINSYQVENLLRLGEYLGATDTNSPYKNNDDLATRGATWEFLRYAVDRGSSPENTYFQALDNAKTNGMANLAAVIGPIFTGGMSTAFRGWAVAQYLDNTGLANDANYQYASWNYRNVLTNQLGNSGYPLKPRALVDGSSQAFTFPAGGAAYLRFRVAAGTSASVVPATLPSAVELILVRTQ